MISSTSGSNGHLPTFSHDGMECPHCGYLNKPDESEHYNESGFELWCGECEYAFLVAPHCSWSWTCRKP